MNGIRPVRRWLNWRGRQRPLLGLALTPATPLERLANPAAVRRSWQQQMDAARRAGCDLARLPSAIGPGSEEFADLMHDTALRGLCSMIEPDPTSEAFARGPSGRGLAPGSGLLALLSVDDAGFDPDLAPRLHETLQAHDVPLVLCTKEPLGPGGAALRSCATDCDVSAIEVDDEGAFEPLSLVSACLAARLEDRPCLLRIRSADPARILRAGRVAFSCGLAGVLVEAVEPRDPVLAAIAALATDLEALDEELPDPLPEQSATVARVCPPAMRQAMLGSLQLLQHATATTPAMCFAELPSRQAPRLVHLPAQGPVTEGLWSLCWSLAHRGSTVLVTGLTLEGDATRHRLAALRIDAERTVTGARGTFPPWMRGRPILDTAGVPLIRRFAEGADPGRLCLLDRPVELDPTDDDSLRIIGTLGTEAGLQAEPWLQQGPLDGVRRVLRFPAGSWESDLGTGELRWRVSQ